MGTAVSVNGATQAGETRYRPGACPEPSRRGAQRYSSGQPLTSYKYTGQRAEAGLGLYYYGARWYDRIAGAKRHPALGRFIQPDTIVPNPGDAKSFDRYAYVNNNPLKYNDPTGHQTACTQTKCNGGREAVVGATTLTIDVAGYSEPPKPAPTYMTAGDGCLYGCTNGLVLYYLMPGEVYGQSEVLVPNQSINPPSIGVVDLDASTVIVNTTRGDAYVDQTLAGNVSIVGYEYSFTSGSGAPTLNVGLGDVVELSAQLWNGEGEVMLGSNGTSVGFAGTLPQYRILATSGQYLNNMGLENFSLRYAEGYQLRSIQVTPGYEGYTGVELLYHRILNDQARTGYKWPEITDPLYMSTDE